MIRSLIISLAKKYVMSAVNDLLDSKKNSVQSICKTMNLWIARLQVIIEELKLILSRVQDGKIDDKEVSDSLDEVNKIIKDF